MSRDTVGSLVFSGMFGLWVYAYTSGERNWLVTAGGYVFAIVFGVAALGIIVGIVLWTLKMLDVIADLPWTLDRKLNDRS